MVPVFFAFETTRIKKTESWENLAREKPVSIRLSTDREKKVQKKIGEVFLSYVGIASNSRQHILNILNDKNETERERKAVIKFH
jgi:hypothetical protein